MVHFMFVVLFVVVQSPRIVPGVNRRASCRRSRRRRQRISFSHRSSNVHAHSSRILDMYPLQTASPQALNGGGSELQSHRRF
jgi:hypothetical protein